MYFLDNADFSVSDFNNRREAQFPPNTVGLRNSRYVFELNGAGQFKNLEDAIFFAQHFRGCISESRSYVLPDVGHLMESYPDSWNVLLKAGNTSEENFVRLLGAYWGSDFPQLSTTFADFGIDQELVIAAMAQKLALIKDYRTLIDFTRRLGYDLDICQDLVFGAMTQAMHKATQRGIESSDRDNLHSILTVHPMNYFRKAAGDEWKPQEEWNATRLKEWEQYRQDYAVFLARVYASFPVGEYTGGVLWGLRTALDDGKREQNPERIANVRSRVMQKGFFLPPEHGDTYDDTAANIQASQDRINSLFHDVLQPRTRALAGTEPSLN